MGIGLTAVTDIYDNIYNVGIFDRNRDGKKDSAVDVSKKMVDSVLKDMFNW